MQGSLTPNIHNTLQKYILSIAKFFKFPVEVDVNILELITQDILVSEKISFIKIGEGEPRDQILTPIGPLK